MAPHHQIICHIVPESLCIYLLFPPTCEFLLELCWLISVGPFRFFFFFFNCKRKQRNTDFYFSAYWHSVQYSHFSRVWLFATPWTATRQASLSITNSWNLLRLMSIESLMPSNHLILCHPLLLPPSISPGIRVFSNELALRIRWPEYWSFSFSISPSSVYSGLISFRMDWLDLLAVQGTLKSLSNTTVQRH